MTEATIKAFRVTVRDLETGKILTDEITRAWSGMTTRQYKRLKGLTKESLRDNMTTTELILNMLVNAQTMLHACDALNGMKRDIVHHIAKNLGKSLGLKPFTEED